MQAPKSHTGLEVQWVLAKNSVHLQAQSSSRALRSETSWVDPGYESKTPGGQLREPRRSPRAWLGASWHLACASSHSCVGLLSSREIFDCVRDKILQSLI